MSLSCSSDRDDNGVSPLVNDPDISAESQRELLGVWRLKPDLDTQATKVEFARDLAAHYDITQQVPAPTVSNESYDSNTQIYQVDLTINNTLGQDAFDVRLIVYTDNDGLTLKNPDNWTALYDMPGGSFINPFKAYATTQPSRRFANAAFHTETVNIYLPGGALHSDIILAIDASIPSNCEEPYLISNFTQENLASGVGANANITIDVYDWQADVDSVKLHCPAITGNPTDSFSFDSGNTWNLNLINNNGVKAGDYLAMMSATSTGSGNLEFYDVLSIVVGSYQWTKTWGGTGTDYGYSVSLDQTGNAYVTGYFQNTVDFNPEGGGTQTSNGGNDIYLSKFDSSGNWQWSKTWGGINNDYGFSVSLDQSGNAYVTGNFSDTVDFNPDGGGSQTSNGGEDVFLSKFDPSGNWQWTKTWGGTGTDYGNSVSLDQSGSAYVTGPFEGSCDFNPDGGGSQSSNGGYDAYLSKFDSNGNWQWTKTWGGTGLDYGTSISLDQSGNAYVAGIFSDTVDFNPDGGGTQTSNGGHDAFLSKFDSNGDWQWSKIWGGTNTVFSSSLSLDQSGNAYIAGQFLDTADFNPDGGGTQSSNGGYDVFLSKFDSSGNWQWSKTWGGISIYGDYGRSVALDQSGNAYVTGNFQGTVDFNPDGGGTQSSGGDSLSAVFLSKFDPAGIWQWTKTWGGTNHSWGYSVSLDHTDNAYVTGGFGDTVDFNPDGGDSQSSNGSSDVFLWKGSY
jgi:hypothetical protein